MLIGFVITAAASATSDIICALMVGVGVGATGEHVVKYLTQETPDQPQLPSAPLKDEAVKLKTKTDEAQVLIKTALEEQKHAIIATQAKLHQAQVDLTQKGSSLAVAAEKTTALVTHSSQSIATTIDGFSALHIELLRLKNELLCNQEALAEANKKLSALTEKSSEENERFTTLLAKSTQEVIQITKTLKQSEALFTTTHAEKEAQIRELRTEKQQMSAYITKLESTLDELTKKINQLEPSISTLSQKLDASTEENQRQKSEIEALVAVNQRYAEAIKSICETERAAPAPKGMRMFH